MEHVQEQDTAPRTPPDHDHRPAAPSVMVTREGRRFAIGYQQYIQGNINAPAAGGDGFERITVPTGTGSQPLQKMPRGTQAIEINVEGGPVRLRTDGGGTDANTGLLLQAGFSRLFYLRSFTSIRFALLQAGSILNVEYYRVG